MAQKKNSSGDIFSSIGAVSVISNSLSTYDKCRGVFIGTSQSLDFSFDGTNWITFQGCVAGTVIPIQVMAARLNSGSANPNAGDVVFIY